MFNSHKMEKLNNKGIKLYGIANCVFYVLGSKIKQWECKNSPIISDNLTALSL